MNTIQHNFLSFFIDIVQPYYLDWKSIDIIGGENFSEFLVCKAEPLGMHSQAEPGNEG